MEGLIYEPSIFYILRDYSLNNIDGEFTEEEFREVIIYGGGMLINIIIGVVAAVAIAVYMGMLKKEWYF